jgi:hypothetical protein
MGSAAGRARDYSLYFEHRPEYLYVHVDAEDVSYETTRRYWDEIVEMQNKRHYSRILVDNDVANELPIQDIYLVVADLAFEGLAGATCVIHPRHYERDACELEEIVGTNRGLKLKVCESIEDAQECVRVM